jgi:hypothetical protein
MRASNTSDGITAMAVAGTYVVLLGWDMPGADIRARGVLGFAVQRWRQRDGERIWLSGMKTFQAVEPNPAPGEPCRRSCIRCRRSSGPTTRPHPSSTTSTRSSP